jgi:hypothetical protein
MQPPRSRAEKKADVNEGPQALPHSGLLINKPPAPVSPSASQTSRLFFIESSDRFKFQITQGDREFTTACSPNRIKRNREIQGFFDCGYVN